MYRIPNHLDAPGSPSRSGTSGRFPTSTADASAPTSTHAAMNTLCKYCSMPVGQLTRSCPRCRHRWPGLRSRWVRGVLLQALLVCAAAALVALLWTPLLAG
jgi:hypothetical protein